MEQRLKEKKRRQDRQLLNFTPAQIKESKMKRKKHKIVHSSPLFMDVKIFYLNVGFTELLELKKKFEEDKQRVALLKQQRKFKPF